jgi:mRNA-degrading endonuclease RelE of RelBE toxin-antitoxin system
MADVRITPSAARELDSLPLPIRARMLKVFERLTDWPTVSGVKPLRGPRAGYYRLRTGDYRVRIRVDEATVIVDKVGHRSRFYED